MSDEVSRWEFERLDHQVNGNGQDGIRQNVESLLLTAARIEGAQEERAKIDEKRFKRQTLVLTVIGIIVAILAYLQANHQFHTGELHWPQVPHKTLSEPQDKVYASSHKPPETATW